MIVKDTNPKEYKCPHCGKTAHEPNALTKKALEESEAFSKLTWLCGVCGKRRPDDKIAVMKKDINYDGIKMTCNYKYCSDDVDCINKTIEKVNDPNPFS